MQISRSAPALARSLCLGVVAMLAITACGGVSDDAADPDTEATSTADTESLTTDDAGNGRDSGESEGSGATASIDPSTMPSPAQAVVTVDQKTLTYEPPDPADTRLFACDLADEQITVNMQTPEGQSLLVQVVRQDSGEWIGSIVAADPDDNRNYQGTRTYGAEAFAVDGPYMVFVGEFETYSLDDRGNFEDAGEGRVAVTCP